MSTDPTRIDIRLDPEKKRMRGIAAHGNTPFNVPFISQIDGNLWVGGCEDGLVLPDFFQHLVSLYPWEVYTIRHEVSTYLTVFMHDSSDQGFGMVDSIATWVNERRREGPTLVHCQAGLNRSSLVAARALMLGGMTADVAIALIRLQRSPACLCNGAFEAWLRTRPSNWLPRIHYSVDCHG